MCVCVCVYMRKHISVKAALKFGCDAWVMKKREEQRLEAAQMKFLRLLLGITELVKEKNQCIRKKAGAQNIVMEVKEYHDKWLQHVQRMDTNRIPIKALQYLYKYYNINQKDEGIYDDRGRDGETNFILRIKEKETRLTLHEHDDDDVYNVNKSKDVGVLYDAEFYC